MSNPIWPLDLPQSFFLNLSDQRRPAFVAFTVDSGAAQRRLMRRNPPREISSPMVFNQTQRILFDEFYSETLGEGSLPFDWIDPVTLLPATYRFMEYPSFTQNPVATTTLHTCTLNLEKIA